MEVVKDLEILLSDKSLPENMQLDAIITVFRKLEA